MLSEFKKEIEAIFRKGVELEYAYAEDTMPRGVLGLDVLYPGANNPFPLMSELIDLKKEKNFFETRVTENQTGGALNWE